MERRKSLKPGNGPVRLDRVAETLLDPVVSRAGFSSTQVIAAWPEIVGPELAARSRPEQLRWPKRRDDSDSGVQSVAAPGATLIVRAEGIDALEIQHMAANIAERINAIFGWRAVSRVSIRQGPVAVRAEPPKTSPAVPEAPERAGSSEKLDTVEDDELRTALARLGARIAGETDTKV
jgi:hypothetical protein